MEFPSFGAFLAARVPEGLGADPPTIKRLCAGDPEAIDLIDRAEQRPSHRPVSVDIVNANGEVRPDGNSAARAVRALR